ncbi:MAG: type II secretion system protein [Methylococcales bacterium]|jgi:MSHA biogenesis protein MshO|nr:type II secretion system protein [Methylococcales bacterium]MBT7445076.1 type II secretion system protein [Methylococcales bacterium]
MMQRGFTLIEMVMVIMITSIIATLGAKMIKTAFDGYYDVANRVNTLGNADIALHHLRQDIHQALPNSIRLSCNNRCLELLHVRDSGRYRAALSPLATEDILDFSSNDNSFDITSGLAETPIGTAHSISTSNAASACENSIADCLVINPALTGLQDAYQPSNRTTITAALPAINPNQLNFVNFNFPQASTKQRFYIVDTPITYICDPTTGTLQRYHDYTITPNLVSSDAELLGRNNPAERSLLSNHITDCQFQLQGDAVSGSTVSINLTYSYQDPALNQGEIQTYSVFNQVKIKGRP